MHDGNEFNQTGSPLLPFTALIAEDDAPIRALIETILLREEFSVEAVHDGRWAIEQLSRRDFHVAILDLMMTGASGFAVLNFLLAQKPQLLRRVIVITAAHGTILRSLQKFGVFAIVKKPFDLQAFKEIVFAAARQTRDPETGAIISSLSELPGSCPSAGHRWKERARTSSEVCDVVNQSCDRCASERVLYFPHTG